MYDCNRMHCVCVCMHACVCVCVCRYCTVQNFLGLQILQIVILQKKNNFRALLLATIVILY